MYRHWHISPYSYLPLDTLRCDAQYFTAERLFSEIYPAAAKPLNPEHDYWCFEKLLDGSRHPTACDIDNNTWDYPIVALSTPSGVDTGEPAEKLWPFMLIEGHSRYRYLHARYRLGYQIGASHAVYVLTSPVVAASDKN